MGKFPNLGVFLKHKRVAAGFTQLEAAKDLGYSTAQFVSDWERGVSSPPVVIFKSLATLYGIKSRDLFDAFIQETTGNYRKAFKESKSELS